MMDIWLGAITTTLSPICLLFNLIGVILGIIFGALPGLNSVVGVALLIPVTYGMDPSVALIMLAGLYMGATYGGSISAILLNCPGAAEAACTAINGNLMARAGRAKEALLYSVISSGIGGIFGCLVLLFFTPYLAGMALKFGPPEMFLVCFGGLAIIGSLMGKSLARGFFAVCIGMILSTIGVDNLSSNYRITFGSLQLTAGLDLIPVVVGMFAASEMIALLGGENPSGSLLKMKEDSIKQTFVWKTILKKEWLLTLKSAVIGTIIGILPGTGGAIAAFVSYGEAQRLYSGEADFGKGNGDVRGIIAPETANNAAVGGSLVPLLALGIPGSATSALLYGALTIQGIIPGPRLMLEHAPLAYALMVGLLLSTIMMLLIGSNCSGIFSKILLLKINVIVPVVLVLCMIGAFSARNSMFDIGICIFFALVGLWFKKADIPLPPILIAMILGRTVEENFRRSLTIAMARDMNVLEYVFLRPLSLALIIIVLLLVYANAKTALRKNNTPD